MIQPRVHRPSSMLLPAKRNNTLRCSFSRPKTSSTPTECRSLTAYRYNLGQPAKFHATTLIFRLSPPPSPPSNPWRCIFLLGASSHLGYDKAFLFGSGGQLGITEFSWNPTDKTGDPTQSECQANFPGRRCFGQQFVPFVTADYWIPQ